MAVSKKVPPFCVNSPFMIRAGISLAIVFMMVFAFSGYLGVFKLRQYQIRKEVKTMIKTGAPDSLKFDFYLDEIESDPSQITWIHAKEFRYRGEMYDILSQSTTADGRLLMHCIHDVKESGLFAELDRMVREGMNSNPQQRNQKQHWHKLFHSLFIADSDFFSTDIADRQNQHFTLYIFTESDDKAQPPSPPPQFVV